MAIFIMNYFWSERQDLNLRPLPPQGSALARLSYAPIFQNLSCIKISVNRTSKMNTRFTFKEIYLRYYIKDEFISTYKYS